MNDSHNSRTNSSNGFNPWALFEETARDEHKLAMQMTRKALNLPSEGTGINTGGNVTIHRHSGGMAKGAAAALAGVTLAGLGLFGAGAFNNPEPAKPEVPVVEKPAPEVIEKSDQWKLGEHEIVPP